MNIYLSGLGINGKTHIIDRLDELGFKVQRSKNREYLRLIEGTQLEWDGRVVFFMKLVNYLDLNNTIFDRSLIDQLLIMNWANSGRGAYHLEGKEVFGEELIDKYMQVFADQNKDSLHILIKITSDEFLSGIIDRPEFKRDPRSSIYQSVEQYRECESYFNEEFLRLTDKFSLNTITVEMDRPNNVDQNLIINKIIQYESMLSRHTPLIGR